MKTYLLGILAMAAMVAFPGGAHAALFAYVNQSGEVRTVEAATPEIAIQTAPSIAARSGVILLDSSSDQELVGDSVSGT